MHAGPASSTRATWALPATGNSNPAASVCIDHAASVLHARCVQSGDLFRFFLYDATNAADRSSLRAIVGEPAELLTWRFGTVARGELLNLAEAMQHNAPPPSMTSGPADLVSVSHRLDNSTTLRNADVAKILIVTIADYLEQMVETNGWCAPPAIEGATRGDAPGATRREGHVSGQGQGRCSGDGWGSGALGRSLLGRSAASAGKRVGDM